MASKTICILLFFTFIAMASTQTGCPLCMKTYKSMCTICYNKCNETKQLVNCTKYSCVQYENGTCTLYNTTTLDNSTCLAQCCPAFATNTSFNESNFNLCIERDAYTPNSINIGLTLGLILSLLFLLFVTGLACNIALILIDSKQQSTVKHRKQVKQMPTAEQAMQIKLG